MPRDVVSRANLGAVPAEIFSYISSISEEIHDVAKIPCVLQPQRVAEFVQTGQVDDAVAKQRVSSGASGNFRAQRISVRPYEDGCTLPPGDHDRQHFSVLAAVRPGP